MNKASRCVRNVLVALLLLVLLTVIALNTPWVQQRTVALVASALENRIGTRITLGEVHWRLPSDIVIDHLALDDQEGDELFGVERVAVRVEWRPLLRERRLSICNVRLFGPRVRIVSDSPDAPTNLQFLVDAFASSDSTRSMPLNALRINSLLISDAAVRRDVASEPQTPGVFNPSHIDLRGLSAHLSLKTLTTDSVSAILRQLTFREQSGLQVDDAQLRLVANRNGATVAGFRLQLPGTDVRMDSLLVNYRLGDTAPRLSDIAYSVHFKRSTFSPSDLAALMPVLGSVSTRFYGEGAAKGTTERVNVDALSVFTQDRDFRLMLRGKADFRGSVPAAEAAISHLSVTERGWDRLGAVLSALQQDAGGGLLPVPVAIPADMIAATRQLRQRVGNVDLSGTVSYHHDGAADLQLATSAGRAEVSASLSRSGDYTLQLDGHGVNLRRLLADDTFGTTSLTLRSRGTLSLKEPVTLASLSPRGTCNATLRDFQYRGHTYAPLSLDGSFGSDGIAATARMDDALAGAIVSLRMAGDRYEADADLRDVDLHALGLLSSHAGDRISMRATAKLAGTDIDNLNGMLTVDSLRIAHPDHDYTIRHTTFSSTSADGMRTLLLTSDDLSATLGGRYELSTLPTTLMAALSTYEPALLTALGWKRVPVPSHKASDDCYFTLRATSLRPLQEFLGIPVTLTGTARLQGSFFERERQLWVNAEVPQIAYGDQRAKALSLSLDNRADTSSLRLAGSATLLADDGTPYLASIGATLKHDRMNSTISWASSEADAFEGALNAATTFSTDARGKLRTDVAGQPASVILNRTTWNLAPFAISAAAGRVDVNDFRFYSADQHFSVDGVASASASDTLRVSLDDANMEYLLSLITLPSVLQFGGKLSGEAIATSLLSERRAVAADISIAGLTFCHGPLGDATAHVTMDDGRLAFRVAATDEAVSADVTTRVDGTVYLPADSLDLVIDADGTDITFLSTMLSGVLSDVSGNAYGRLRIGGPFRHLDMDGDLLARDASLHLPSTECRYAFSDTVSFRPGAIIMDRIDCRDRYGNHALLDGRVTHDGFRSWGYDILVKADDILGLDLPNTGSDQFYSTIFGNGDVHIWGNDAAGFHADIDASTSRGSLFALNLSAPGSSDQSAFLTIRDGSQADTQRQLRRAERLQMQREERRQRRREARRGPSTTIDVHAAITDEATIKLVLDQATDDHLAVRGTGPIHVLLEGSNLSLSGTYTISRGSYRLSLENLVSKNFEIVSGSTITFDGDPMNAVLDITARHTVASASLADLTADASSMERLRADCLIRITGTPSAPLLAFDIDLPQGTEEQKTILRGYTATDEQKNLQFVYLLALGKFYTYDYAQTPAGGTTAMQSFLANTLSGQINNILSSVIDNDNWSIAGNIATSENPLGSTADETEDLLTNMEFRGVLEGRMLNNRLLVNGNFGYRDNPLYATNFVGDLDARYLLVPGYNFWLKGYSKTNDRYFSRTALTTQGVGIAYSLDFDHLLKKSPAKTTDEETTTNE